MYLDLSICIPFNAIYMHTKIKNNRKLLSKTSCNNNTYDRNNKIIYDLL